MPSRSLVFHFVVGATGILLAFIGAMLGWVVFPAVVKSQVADTIALKNGSDAWNRWEKLPLPMQFKVYIFNITNPWDIRDHGAKPIVEEFGPYVYLETRYKTDIEMIEDNDRAIYNQWIDFDFDADASNGTEDDIFTVINVPALSFAQITYSISELSGTISSYNATVKDLFAWENEDDDPIFIKAKVRDYLFGEIKMNCTLPDPLDFEHINHKLMCTSYSYVHPPSVIINPHGDGINTFSFFKYKNHTADGPYEVHIGVGDPKNIGQIVTYKNDTHVKNWGGESCNKIHGTDSTIFRPELDYANAAELFVFNSDINRTIKLTYSEDTEFRDIAGKRYVALPSVFEEATTNPDNYCYCPRSVNNLTDFGGCLKSGLLELSSVQGAPVMLSHPHFLYADEYYQNMTDGLNPDPEKHAIHLDLETNTGTPLRGASRVQMNAFLKRIPEIDVMKNYPDKIIPMLWFEEGVELNDELIDMLNTELINILKILEITRWVLVGGGLALTIGTIGFFIYAHKKIRTC